MNGYAELPNLINRGLISPIVSNRNRYRPMLPHLLQQLPHLRMRAQRHRAIRLPQTPDHIQRINPNRPGRAQYGYVFSQACRAYDARTGFAKVGAMPCHAKRDADYFTSRSIAASQAAAMMS